MASPSSSSSLSSMSSPLSSIASRSPSPPGDYPSPPSSHESEKGMKPKSRKVLHSSHCDDSSPPAPKRQRITKDKNKNTEYLDISELNASDNEDVHQKEDVKMRKLINVLRTKRRIVVIAGAGISVSAGIPDFRSSTGLFSSLRNQHKLKTSGKHLFDAAVYRNDNSTSSFHDMVRELGTSTQNAKPTLFHHMLATLAEEGRLMRLYTQNVDGIDTALPPLATTVPLNRKGPWPKTIQLHGGLDKMVCSKCGDLQDFNGGLFEGPAAPLCARCEEVDIARSAAGFRSHGIGRLRPRMVLYNEHNPDEDAIGAVSVSDLKRVPDAVIVVGTSLKIPGTRRLTKELCSVTRARRGGFTAWINLDPEPIGVEFKDCWDMVVRAESDEVARAVALPKWDDKDCGDYVVGGPLLSDMKYARPTVEVRVKPALINALNAQGLATPTDTPRQQSPDSIPLPKLKQTSLAFAPSLTGDLAPKKKKSSRPRKALPSSKPTKAVNAINNTFPATKTTKQPTTKKAFDQENFPSSALFPGLLFTKRTAAPSKSPKSSQVSVGLPCDRLETISPVGPIPSGMAKLLD
ncbi:related to NAD-dependent histone deacetylases [Rhynchosporium secalis]|uniref:Related to NAD-dependent histone deacetylases n=1 Tax=Rhynchosporium secalis TaxID=38038 RepID=A0A1E1MMP2_RHYSE|nr:related to NAD-dependent histone deacetylases [Rhynchosporium secalis]